MKLRFDGPCRSGRHCPRVYRLVKAAVLRWADSDVIQAALKRRVLPRDVQERDLSRGVLACGQCQHEDGQAGSHHVHGSEAEDCRTFLNVQGFLDENSAGV